MPSYQEIRNLIREKKDVLEKKAKQGFTKLLIVPFGMKLDDLVGKYKALILRHKAENKLLATKEKDIDPDEPLDLNMSEPVWVWMNMRAQMRMENLSMIQKNSVRAMAERPKQRFLRRRINYLPHGVS